MDKKQLLLMVTFGWIVSFSCRQPALLKIAEQSGKNEWFINQRLFPYGKVDYQAYRQAVEFRNSSVHRNLVTGAGNNWQFAGCINIGGRITDVEMHDSSTQTMFLGAASGGVFKSTDAGSTWNPIFDQETSLSIGDLAIAPSNHHVIYVGTGEANGGGGSLTYDGNGIYKSVDEGLTWSHIGLVQTRNTGRLAVDPLNPDRVFAATMGDLFGNNSDRGLYRTTDGGTTWQQVLWISDSTGAIDVVIHPQHPDTVFACLWERVRRPDRRNYGGPSSGIYRSFDGGTTWTKLTTGIPSGNIGRIGIAIARSSPNRIYATVTDNLGAHIGIFRSDNYGNSWFNVTGNFSPGAYSYWFGRIKADPTDPDIVYLIDFDLWKSDVGGTTWNNITGPAGVHVDQHEVYIHSQNNNFLLLGNDGGMHLSYDGGNNWTHNETIPITQFYTCEIDETNPTNLYGGTQDNGVICTTTGNLDDWFSIMGGDGFVVLVDPNNPSLVYCEYQYAGLNTGLSGVDPNDRTNWNTPFILNPLNPNTLYLGTDKVYKSTDNGNFWTPLSPDLTNGSGTASYPIVYGTITTLAVAPSDTSVIWVGTDDGNIQFSTDEGNSWTLVSGSLPLRWVTRIAVDPVQPMTAYITLSGYRYHDNMSHVYKTDDGGITWLDIGANLPDVPVNDIILDSTLANLFIATDAGVFYTAIDSLNWQLLGQGMPVVPVTDIRLHEPTRTLLAATYGRSLYKYDLNYLVSNVRDDQISYVSGLQVKCFPNPFHKLLFVEVYAPEETEAKIELTDISGKLFLSVFDGILLKGRNFFSLKPATGSYPMTDGIYLLNTKSKRKNSVMKLIYHGLN